VPTERVVTLALFHDAEEVITGDIPTPVKHHNEQLLRSLRQVEALASERLLGMVPEPLLGTYRPLLSGTERDPVFRVNRCVRPSSTRVAAPGLSRGREKGKESGRSRLCERLRDEGITASPPVRADR
jgi:hypothetical protein